MLERERLSLREYREQIEAEERAERERREAPIRAAENKFRETSRKLAAVMHERLLGTVRDVDRIPVDPSVTGIRMSLERAKQFNRAEFRRYRDENPEVYWTPELVDNIGQYFAVNGLQIVTAKMIASIVERYREYGLLPDPPQEVEPEQAPEPEPEQPSGPITCIGVDWQTGTEREFTQREIDRMSADEYRRAFPVASDFGSLFTAMAEQREQA